MAWDADMSRSYSNKLIAIIFLGSIGFGNGSASILPVGIDEYEFIYDRIERIETTLLDRFDYQLGPYQIDQFQNYMSPFDKWYDIKPDRIGLFGIIGENYSASKEIDTKAFESIRGGFAAAPGKNLFLYGNFLLDEKKTKDVNYTGKKWRGLAGGVEKAFLYYDTKSFDLRLGRFASFWGVRNSLVFSPEVPLDGLEYRWRWGRLTLSYRLVSLNGLRPTVDSVSLFENRYLAGHRLDLHISGRLRVGILETVLFGGPGRQIEPFYLNPLISFHAAQLNEGIDDNTFLGFDFTAKPWNHFKLYGQIIVDDFQIDNKTQGDQEPNQTGLTAGIYLADFWKSFDIRSEYTRVANWTFNQGLDRNRYLKDGRPIGSVLGNDYEFLEFTVTKWFNQNLAARINLSNLRQGEGRVDAEWSAHWLLSTDEYKESFPSGVVEATREISVSVQGYIGKIIYADIKTGLKGINNYAHIADDNRTRPFVWLRISTFLFSELDISN